jgi:hypothetical protein
VSAGRPRPLTTEEVAHLLRATGDARQIQANIHAYVWPSMGNSQRFNEPH